MLYFCWELNRYSVAHVHLLLAHADLASEVELIGICIFEGLTEGIRLHPAGVIGDFT